MNKEKYTIIELSIISFLLLNSFTSTIIFNLYKGYNLIEIVVSLFISMIIGYPIISFLLNRKNNHIKPLLIICSLIISIFLLQNISIVIKETLLQNTEIAIIMLLFLIISYFLSNKGLKSIVIASNLLFFIYILVLISIFLLNINNINFINISNTNFNINKLNILCPLVYSLAPLLYLSIIPKNSIKNYDKYNKTIKKIYIFYYIYLIIKFLFIISILGIENISLINYPDIEIIKSIKVLNNIKYLLLINVLIENFICLSLSIFYISFYLKKKWNLIIPILIFILTISINNLNKYILLISNIIFIIIHLFLSKKSNSR